MKGLEVEHVGLEGERSGRALEGVHFGMAELVAYPDSCLDREFVVGLCSRVESCRRST